MIRLIIRGLLFISIALILYVFGVLIYAMITDFSPESQIKIEIENIPNDDPIPSDTFSLLTWNIGYAGLGEESDFFYDGGENVRMTQDIVSKNLAGILQVLDDVSAQTDFIMLQEVDINSKRSYFNNQLFEIKNTLPDFGSAYADNYLVNFIPSPFLNPFGKVKAGITSLYKDHIYEATRYSFPGNYAFPHYLFFLDRCFILIKIKTALDKDLIVINTHNSAYDDGNLKKQQLALLKQVMLEEYTKGNYVIAGGDWNQLPPDSSFLKNQSNVLPKDFPEPGWQAFYDLSTSTFRKIDKPYAPKTTQTGVIDYFIASPNVRALECNSIDLQFKYSDHQPVSLQVILE